MRMELYNYKQLALLTFGLFALNCATSIARPGKTQFEAERTVLLKRIKNIEQVLHQTETEKKAGLGQLNALNEQISSNALLLQTIGQEVGATNQAIQQKQQAITTLEQELGQLKREYEAMVCIGAKALHDIHLLMFIFSSSSFHNFMQRLRYVKHYARIRQKHFGEIEQVKTALQAEKVAATQRMQAKRQLLNTRQAEKEKLTSLKNKQTQLVGQLGQQHKQLAKELEERNRAVNNLDKLISDLIQQELKAQAAEELSQTQEVPPIAPAAPSGTKRPAPAKPKAISTKTLTAPFRKNRGKLPWPVKRGFISGKFGICPHPVLRNVQVENLGINIQTQEGAQTYAIFEGVVKTIAFVPGMNQVVIIQHGAYHSVYAKLKHVTVKVGQYVQANALLGTVYTDGGGTTELQLQLWQGAQKLNPAQWLRRK